MKNIYDVSFFRVSSDEMTNTIKYEVGSKISFDVNNRLKAYSDILSGIYNYNLDHRDSSVSLISCSASKFRVNVDLSDDINMTYDIAFDIISDILKDAKYVTLKVMNGDDKDAKRA